MKALPPKQFTESSLMLWFMHRLSKEFENKAILKGGMALALFDSPRKTNDLDYVFVPYTSKKQIEAKLRKIANEIPGARVTLSQTSKHLRVSVFLNDISLQLEANVALECKSQVTSTASLARASNELPKPIRIMSLDVALAHKLAAWNERRLFRDLYDCYFLYEVQGETFDLDILKSRLQKIESRIPKLKSIKKLTINAFADILEEEVKKLRQEDVEAELSGLMDPVELFNLEKRLKTSIHRLANFIRQQMDEKVT